MLLISITHNENLNPLLNLLINCISTRSEPQILSIQAGYTILLLNFLIFGLCNSPANSLIEIILFLIADLFESVVALPEFFYQNIYRTLRQVHVNIHHIFDF